MLHTFRKTRMTAGHMGRLALVLAVLGVAGPAGGQPAAAVPPKPPTCQNVSVIGVGASPAAPLTVTVNDELVGVYDGYAGPELDAQLKPGVNTVGFSYPAPGTAATQAELWCRSASGANRKILGFRPTAGRLSFQMQVSFLPAP